MWPTRATGNSPAAAIDPSAGLKMTMLAVALTVSVEAADDEGAAVGERRRR